MLQRRKHFAPPLYMIQPPTMHLDRESTQKPPTTISPDVIVGGVQDKLFSGKIETNKQKTINISRAFHNFLLYFIFHTKISILLYSQFLWRKMIVLL